MLVAAPKQKLFSLGKQLLLDGWAFPQRSQCVCGQLAVSMFHIFLSQWELLLVHHWLRGAQSLPRAAPLRGQAVIPGLQSSGVVLRLPSVGLSSPGVSWCQTPSLKEGSLLVQASGPVELQVPWQNFKKAGNSGASASPTTHKESARGTPQHLQDLGRRSGAGVGYQGSCLILEIKISPQTLMRVQARF